MVFRTRASLSLVLLAVEVYFSAKSPSLYRVTITTAHFHVDFLKIILGLHQLWIEFATLGLARGDEYSMIAITETEDAYVGLSHFYYHVMIGYDRTLKTNYFESV